MQAEALHESVLQLEEDKQRLIASRLYVCVYFLLGKTLRFFLASNRRNAFDCENK